MIKKKLIVTLLLIFLVMSFVSYVDAAGSVVTDSPQVTFTQAPGQPFRDENNRIQEPFRVAMEFYGASAGGDADNRTAIAEMVDLNDSNQEDQDYILIYNGHVADKYGVEKVAQMAKSQGYSVEYISNLSELPDMLNGAKAFIIGGTIGDTGDILEEIDDVKDNLKSYIENGGTYLGICGGVYVASKGSQWPDGYETGMALVDFESFEYDPNYSYAQIITVLWQSTRRTIYYFNGPAFAKNDMPQNATILMYYTNKNQDVAAFSAKVGKGKVVLCGPHPEADATWLIDEPDPLNSETWSDTQDIFKQIFDSALTPEDNQEIKSGNLEYRTHVQNIGWQDWKGEDENSGTTGQSLRLEGIEIKVANLPDKAHQVGIEYKTHVQNIGWQDWVADGKTSGTFGKSLRLEAIQVEYNRCRCRQI
ncbi:BPL-N domain-containing protein [Acetobacterium sp.]|uniref:BPL-N domain-containing protein n=1 Tax=Acetobacterium sp. TaxID=1872094 RepID=UPI003592F4A0